MGVLSSKTDPRWVSITLRPVPLHSINIHGIGVLWEISGQLSECHISVIVIFDAIVILLSHLLVGTLCFNEEGNNASLPGFALIFLPLVVKTKGDAPIGVLTK